MAIWYVDGTNGDDDNDGQTMATAFETFNSGAFRRDGRSHGGTATGGIVQSGDTVIVAGGTYTREAENQGRFGGFYTGGSYPAVTGVLIQSAEGEQVIFDGDNKSGLWTGMNGNWTFKGDPENKMIFRNCSGGSFISATTLDGQASGLNLFDCHFSSSASRQGVLDGSVVEGTGTIHFRIERCIFDGGWNATDDPSKSGLVVGVDCFITSSLFRNWGRSGISGQVGGDSTTGAKMTNCTFVHCGMAGSAWPAAKGVTIRNSIAAYTGVWPKKGVYKKGAIGFHHVGDMSEPKFESSHNIAFMSSDADFQTTTTTNTRTKYWRGTGSLDTEDLLGWDITNNKKSGKYALDFNRSPASGTTRGVGGSTDRIRDQFMVLPSLNTMGTGSDGETVTPFEKHLTVSAWVKLHGPGGYSGSYGELTSANPSDENVSCIMETISDAHGHWSNEREDGWGLYAGNDEWWFWVHGDPNNNDGSADVQDKYAAKFRLTGACDGGGGCAQTGYNAGIDKVHRWNWVVGVYDATAASGNLRIYLNGVLGGDERSDGNQGGAKNQTASLSALNETIYLGVDRTLVQTSHLGAVIGDVGIWSSSLPGEAIRDIYKQFLTGGYPHDLTANVNAYTSSATLKGYWRMGGGSDPELHGSGAAWTGTTGRTDVGTWTITDESSGSNDISSSTRPSSVGSTHSNADADAPWCYGNLVPGPMAYRDTSNDVYHQSPLYRIFQSPDAHNYKLRISRDDSLAGAPGLLQQRSGSNPAVYGGAWYRSGHDNPARVKYRDLEGKEFNCANPSIGCYSHNPWVNIGGDYALSNSIKVEQTHTNLDNASQGDFVFKHFEQGPQWPIFTGSSPEGRGLPENYNLFRLAVRGPMNLRRHNPCRTISQPYSSSAG